MSKKIILAILVIVLVLPVVFAQVAPTNPKAEAKIAGYHNVIYANYMDNVDSSNALFIFPQTVTFGWGTVGRGLNIQGDASGNYVIGPAAAAAHITFPSRVDVTGDLYSSGDIRMVSGKALTSSGNVVIRLS
jgi:opacity protein-like surface antigen